MMPEWLCRFAEIALAAVTVASAGVMLFDRFRPVLGVRRAASLAGLVMFCAGVLAAVLLP